MLLSRSEGEKKEEAEKQEKTEASKEEAGKEPAGNAFVRVVDGSRTQWAGDDDGEGAAMERRTPPVYVPRNDDTLPVPSFEHFVDIYRAATQQPDAQVSVLTPFKDTQQKSEVRTSQVKKEKKTRNETTY